MTLISRAFPGPGFAGVGAVAATVGTAGAFSAVARIPRRVARGRYDVTALRPGAGIRVTVGDRCEPYFADDVTLGGDTVRVYRCSWGWYVRNSVTGSRSRYLDQAFVDVLGAPLRGDALRALVATLESELTAERDRTGATAARDVAV